MCVRGIEGLQSLAKGRKEAAVRISKDFRSPKRRKFSSRSDSVASYTPVEEKKKRRRNDRTPSISHCPARKERASCPGRRPWGGGFLVRHQRRKSGTPCPLSRKKTAPPKLTTYRRKKIHIFDQLVGKKEVDSCSRKRGRKQRAIYKKRGC